MSTERWRHSPPKRRSRLLGSCEKQSNAMSPIRRHCSAILSGPKQVSSIPTRPVKLAQSTHVKSAMTVPNGEARKAIPDVSHLNVVNFDFVDSDTGYLTHSLHP